MSVTLYAFLNAVRAILFVSLAVLAAISLAYFVANLIYFGYYQFKCRCNPSFELNWTSDGYSTHLVLYKIGKNKTMLPTLLSIFIGIFIFLLVLYTLATTVLGNIPNKTALISELHSAIHDNIVSAQEEYSGFIEVTGTIKEIHSEEQPLPETFVPDDSLAEIVRNRAGYRVHLFSEDTPGFEVLCRNVNEDYIYQYNIGDKLTIRGLFSNAGKNYCQLVECSVLDKVQ